MTMRTYLSPIGYNSTSVTRTVLSHGVDRDDQIVLIRPTAETDTSRADEAINDVQRLLGEVQPEIAVTTERIPHDDFETAVVRCQELLQAAGGAVTVNLGGGARDILLPLMTAVLTEIQQIDSVLIFSDVDGKVREWELPTLSTTVSDTVYETLTAIAEVDGEISIPQLTETTGRPKSTVARHVDLLEQNDAVAGRREGKTKRVSLTLTGRLVVNGE
ncbi:CRISPR-associated CARF protein Csa3 [Halocatena salina]|uniref:CRISPR-associated CARF protein Csa3 n=1 Tax=Halocatena salina TaxID=2934340 RepID=A0A8U0A801_9EURY|nr:CRISPR-associated CARF protein Csa3 [Halocatena salina]UPM45265.1 CRISPR-associated CARF protein Csa3 [Halocatena salina]